MQSRREYDKGPTSYSPQGKLYQRQYAQEGVFTKGCSWTSLKSGNDYCFLIQSPTLSQVLSIPSFQIKNVQIFFIGGKGDCSLCRNLMNESVGSFVFQDNGLNLTPQYVELFLNQTFANQYQRYGRLLQVNFLVVIQNGESSEVFTMDLFGSLEPVLRSSVVGNFVSLRSNAMLSTYLEENFVGIPEDVVGFLADALSSELGGGDLSDEVETYFLMLNVSQGVSSVSSHAFLSNERVASGLSGSCEGAGLNVQITTLVKPEGSD